MTYIVERPEGGLFDFCPQNRRGETLETTRSAIATLAQRALIYSHLSEEVASTINSSLSPAGNRILSEAVDLRVATQLAHALIFDQSVRQKRHIISEFVRGDPKKNIWQAKKLRQDLREVDANDFVTWVDSSGVECGVPTERRRSLKPVYLQESKVAASILEGLGFYQARNSGGRSEQALRLARMYTVERDSTQAARVDDDRLSIALICTEKTIHGLSYAVLRSLPLH